MRDGILWLLIAVYAFVTVVADGLPKTFGSPANLPLAIVIPLLFALFHGAVRYGWRGIVAFMVLCIGISTILENLSVLTGFPFGHYHYTDVLGPKLYLVPLLIPPAYFGTGYLSWVLASLLLDTDKRRDLLSRIAVPVVATFIMVGWDVCLDPGSSTIGRPVAVPSSLRCATLPSTHGRKDRESLRCDRPRTGPAAGAESSRPPSPPG